MAQLSWIQSKNTEWWQEAFSKAWLESDFKHKSVPRPSCTLPDISMDTMRMETQPHPCGFMRLENIVGVLSDFPKCRVLLALANTQLFGWGAEPWPSGPDLLISSQTLPNDDFIAEGNGDTTVTHIPKKAWQAALSS